MKKLTGWKLFVYSMAGLGPNLLMTLVTGYLNDALLSPTGIDPAKTFTGSLIVSVGLCSILFFAAKVLGTAGAQLMADGELLAAAKEEFASRTAATPYICPIPKDIVPKY